MRKNAMTIEKNKWLFYGLLALGGALGGVVNGFFGSGGGIILIFVIGWLCCDVDTKDRFFLAVLSILPMSTVSLFFYLQAGKVSFADIRPYILAALVGGVLGSWLFCRISPKLLKLIFAILMLWAGIRMLK